MTDVLELDLALVKVDDHGVVLARDVRFSREPGNGGQSQVTLRTPAVTRTEVSGGHTQAGSEHSHTGHVVLQVVWKHYYISDMGDNIYDEF